MPGRRPTRAPRLDQLATNLAGAAAGLAQPTEVILALTGLGVMLAPHAAARRTLDRLAGSDDPAAHALEIISGGVAVTPHLWGHFDPLLAALQQAADSDDHKAIGRLAGLLADADLDQHCGDDASYGPDLLGGMYSQLRSPGGRAARGAFYTPPSVALLMAMMTMPTEHSTVCDPTVGSGLMLWAAATAMRQAGLDPRTCTWFGVDIDPIALAIAAINTATWNLHDITVLHCGNGLVVTPAQMLDSHQARLRAGARRYLSAPDARNETTPDAAALG